MSDTIDPTEPAPWDIIRVAMVIGPVSGYFHQYYTMHKMKTSIGFSSVTCGVLLVSSIIRIFFWIGDPFDIALLYQSILMTIVQLFLLELCVRYYPWVVQLPGPVTHSIPPSRLNSVNRANTNAANSGPDHITTRASRYQNQGWYKEHLYRWGVKFWNWPTIGPYYLFLVVFTLAVGLSLVIIGKTEFYVAVLGLAALGIEATVPLPQAIENHRSKSTAGFSPLILLMWVIGDSFKTYYYISTNAKYQFVGCGIIQLCIDCVIITQTIIYSKYWKDAMRKRDGVFGIARSSPSQNHVGGATRRSSSEALLSGADDDDGNHQERH